jgi:hypothetical protein
MTADFAVKSRYGYRADKRDWLGVVYRRLPDGRTLVLTVGTEPSERAIRHWCRLALRNRPWDPDGTPVPDAVDRAKNRPH